MFAKVQEAQHTLLLPRTVFKFSISVLVVISNCDIQCSAAFNARNRNSFIVPSEFSKLYANSAVPYSVYKSCNEPVDFDFNSFDPVLKL